MHELALQKYESERSPTFLLGTHVLLVLGALLLAIGIDMASALVLAAPSIVILIAGLVEPRVAAPDVTVMIDRPRALEEDSIVLTAKMRAGHNIAVLDVELLPLKTIEHHGSLRWFGSLAARSETSVDFELVFNDWGVFEIGEVRLRARDRFGLTALNLRYKIVGTVRVHIHEEVARSLSEPDRFRRLVGSHRSEERGVGCEIADIRPYQPGDRLQQLNWRISARNDEPWITLRHPDRSTTVVLLVDAFQRFGHHRADALRRSIRATLGMARLHLSAQDPVGMLIMGQQTRWFPPELGPRQLHLLTDALLDLSTRVWGEHPRSRTVPHRLIPHDAIVIAISSLENGRFRDTLVSLRGRGHSVQVIEPFIFWPKYGQFDSAGSQMQFRQAWRIYSLQRRAVRNRLVQAGIPVVPWEEDQPVEAALISLRARQRARRTGTMSR